MTPHPLRSLSVLACCLASVACGSATSTSSDATQPSNSDAAAGGDAGGSTSDTATVGDGSATASDTASADTSSSDGAPAADGNGDASATDTMPTDAATPPDTMADATATDTGGADSGPSGGAIPVSQLKAKLLDALCQQYVNCPVKPEGIQFGSVPGCKAFLGANLTEFDELVALVEAGTLGYDPQQAALCIAELGGCDMLVAEGPAPLCDSVFLGKTADGGSCNRDEMCKSGYCKGFFEGCAGTCQAKGGIGAPCGSSVACQAGLGCVGEQCKQLKTVAIGGPCVSASECNSGLWCSFGATGGQCQAQGDVNAPCQGPGSCKTGLSCAMGLDKPPSCQPDLKAGQVCTVFAQPGMPKCGPGLVCAGSGGMDGTCVAVAGLGGACQSSAACGGLDMVCKQGKCAVLPTLGEPCKPANPMAGEFLACVPPATCNDQMVCAPLPGAGQPCAMPNQACAEGATCDFATQQCKALPGKGEPCQGQCKQGLICDPDTCKEPLCGN